MKQNVLDAIRAAKDGVSAAEDDLAQLLAKVQAASRAEKITISEALRSAFNKLRAAREDLVTLERLARSEE